MTTQTLDRDTIAKFVDSAPSDANGISREVWFFGDDLVIKDDSMLPGANECEYNNFKDMKPGSFERNGVTYHVKFPHMEMVAGYLVAERIHYPEAVDVLACDCDYEIRCMAWWALCSERNTWDSPAPTHDSDCPHNIVGIIEEIAAKEYGIFDMHDENFMWDEATNTAWFIDIAS